MEDKPIEVIALRHDLSVSRKPEVVLEEARQAAKALTDVLSKKKKPVIMNGEQYLEFEDWMTCGKFYGITAKVVTTEQVEFGEVRGFLARAVAYHIPTAQEISAAESMCLNDEKNWKDKPLFQLRSMAQTRACSKALRNVLAWVVVLAGYKPTPAEEIVEGTLPATLAPSMDTARLISDPQRKRFYAIWKKSGKTDLQVRTKLLETIGVEDSSKIPASKYEALVAWALTPDAEAESDGQEP